MRAVGKFRRPLMNPRGRRSDERRPAQDNTYHPTVAS
jgi:hypothetical protein